MDYTVESQEQGSVLDDAALNPVQETTESLSTISEAIEQAQAEPQTQEQAPQKEPGWIRQRVDKAVSRALQEQEQRLRAEFAATLEPIRESMYSREADDLVAAGEFKTRERALEYVRLKAGAGVSAAPEEQPTQPGRDARGRFVSASSAQQPAQNGDPVVQARAELLAAQAEKIKNNRGLDVMQALNADPELQKRVFSGDWDFYDVAEVLETRNGAPAPVRSPNGASSGAVSIANMTDAQFARLQANLAAGKIYDAR